MLNKSEIIKKWNEMSDKDKQLYLMMAGATAGLFLRGLIRCKDRKDVINLVVPKDADVIIIKGGK